jgi:hypothetical protein
VLFKGNSIDPITLPDTGAGVLIDHKRPPLGRRSGKPDVLHSTLVPIIRLRMVVADHARESAVQSDVHEFHDIVAQLPRPRNVRCAILLDLQPTVTLSELEFVFGPALFDWHLTSLDVDKSAGNLELATGQGGY